jgi:ankyrin repeat protein
MKAEVNSMTPKGETALTIAVKRNHQKVAEILIDAGANVAHVSKVGLRVIEYAILAGFYELAQLIFRKLPQ